MVAPGSPQQGFPRLDTPFVREDGIIEIPWYRLLIQLFKLAGGGKIPLAQGVYLILENGHINAYDTEQNFIAQLAESNTPGGPAIPITPVGSPYVYTATASGTLITYAGKLEASRDLGVSWKPVTLTGGALPMLVADRARITWYGASAPQAVFLPS